MYEDKDKEIREYAAALELVGIRKANLLLAIVNELKGDKNMDIVELINNEMLNTTRIGRDTGRESEYEGSYLSRLYNAFNVSPVLFKPLRDRRSIVTDVNVIVPNKVVEVTFADCSKQKVVCSVDDTFSLEQAISICIAKNLIGGTKAYNKAVSDGMKAYQKKIAKQETDNAESERIKAKKVKTTAKRAERIARKRAKEIEEQIEIQKEAIVRANKEMGK